MLLGTMMFVAAPVPHASADDAGACRIFLCMAGKLQGNGEVQGCQASIQTYFSPPYWVFDPDGTFNGPLTAIRRDTEVIGPCATGTQGSNAALRSGIGKSIEATYGPKQFDVP